MLAGVALIEAGVLVLLLLLGVIPVRKWLLLVMSIQKSAFGFLIQGLEEVLRYV